MAKNKRYSMRDITKDLHEYYRNLKSFLKGRLKYMTKYAICMKMKIKYHKHVKCSPY